RKRLPASEPRRASMWTTTYSTAPPARAIALISSAGVKPCQILSVNSGSAPPTTCREAAASEGPMESAGTTPTTRQRTTSTSTGTRIHFGGSSGCLGVLLDGGPKKTSTAKRSEYATLPIPANVAATGSVVSTIGIALRKTVSEKNISLDKKPLSSGTPAIAAVATSA